MKTKNLLIALLALFPISLIAQSQSDFEISGTYLPEEDEILLHLSNHTDKPMVIRNSFGGYISGSSVEFILIDKEGKDIGFFYTAFLEGILYQRYLNIEPHSTKTIEYDFEMLSKGTREPSKIYSVDAICSISYILEGGNELKHFRKDLNFKIK